MTKPATIVGLTLGIILGVVLIASSLTILCFFEFFVVTTPHGDYSIGEVRFTAPTGKRRMFCARFGRIFGTSDVDLENGHLQDVLQNDLMCQSNKLFNLEVSQLRGVPGEDVDFESTIDAFFKFKKGNGEGNPHLLDQINNKRRDDAQQTVIARPSESAQLYLASQYDSFSRTLMLQNLIQEAIGNEYVIRSVRDPFSANVISVGGIVAVVKPFHGTGENEFRSLQTGDLLRIVTFYIKKIDPAVDIGEVTGSTVADQEVFMDRNCPNYQNLCCTGIILNTYLDYAHDTFSLRLKNPSSATYHEMELLKDFPLGVVSLETTLLQIEICHGVVQGEQSAQEVPIEERPAAE